MELLVGRRFYTLYDIKDEIEKLTGKTVEKIFISESDRCLDCDNMIDYCFENDDNVYTMFYLIDNAYRFYITEV